MKTPEEEFKDLKEKFGLNLYDKILELRKFEIENFWKRTLFFWGTIAIVLVGYFGAKIETKYFIFISFIGLLYNIIFSMSIRGSKYWQEHWETMAVIYENNLEFKLFKSEMSDYIFLKNSHYITFPFRFSVSKLTMLLSDITVILWFMLWIKDMSYLFTEGCVFFEFSKYSTLHLFTVYTLVVHFAFVLYIIYFFKKGDVFYKPNF